MTAVSAQQLRVSQSYTEADVSLVTIGDGKWHEPDVR